MAALSTEIALRYPSAYLINLTNPGAPAATSIATAVRDAAIADAEAAFDIYVGAAFDESDTRHVSLGCDGVIAKLTQYGGKSREEGRELWDTFVMGVKALRKKGKPVTTAKNVPTVESTISTPYFDSGKLSDYGPSGEQ